MGGAMRRDLRRSIRRSLGRFLAIVAIIALGSGFLVGLRVSKSAMLATAQDYIDRQDLFDFRVLNTYGYTQSDVEDLEAHPEIWAAEGVTTLDALLTHPDTGEDCVIRLMSLPETVSRPDLQAGRMPQRANECLADGVYFSQDDLGKTITLSPANDADTTERLGAAEFTIVGLCSSPVYMNFERGSTTVGKGSLAAYIYVPQGAFDMNGVYTEIQLKLAEDYTMYAPEYNDLLERLGDELEPLAQSLADERYITVRQEAQEKLDEGQADYNEGLKTYERQEKEAQAELESGKETLDANWAEFSLKEKELESGEKALEAAQAVIDSGDKQLKEGRVKLQEQKAAAYQQFANTESQLSSQQTQLKQGLRQLEDGISQIDSGISQIDGGLSQIESGLKQLELALSLADTGLSAARRLLETVELGLEADPENAALLESKASLEAQIADLEAQKSDLEAQKAEALDKQTELQGQKSELETQRAGLEDQRRQAQEGLAQIADGIAQLDSARRQTEDQFAAAEAQLEANRLELENGQAELDENAALLKAGREELEAGRAELEAAQKTYDQSRQEAEKSLADGKKQLNDARRALDKGRKQLLKMEPAQAYVLDRNTNVAYVCIESDADIISGVSRVFPLFFFAVAALVCLTTMSKMVDEERTQIGVLKALGYSGGAISAKYLVYAGTASLLGSVIGVAFGTVIFPSVIWQGYRIMYDFASRVKLVFEATQCALIVVSFTAAMLLVTWLCCRKTLREAPANLIRPKSPKAGKRLLLERLPLWKHLSFLHKVSVRNTFRYRKRLVMMLVGVGGCTALVIAGFGIRDSITNIAEFQFEEVTTYDMSVTFEEEQTPEAQDAFRQELAGAVSDALFLHESTADATAGAVTKSVHLMLTDGSVEGFLKLRQGNNPVPEPSVGQAVISNGLAEVMGLSTGDTITLRTADMEEMTLTVSGIFDNNVYHYVLTAQDSAQAQWGHRAKINTAYLHVNQEDVHEVSALVSARKNVLNVAVSEDMALRVSNMLTSVDYIVALVILCAAALAFIVIYNLTNINITERTREIATIKVLGFYPWESASYVFREGMALTAMGCAVGLLAGKFLSDFVISQIRVDMVYFTSRVTVPSYLWAVLLTFLFSALVDVFLFFKLERINMAEALKSVE